MFKFSIRNNKGLLQPIEVHHLRQYLYLMGSVAVNKSYRYENMTTDDLCADVLAELVSQSCNLIDEVADKRVVKRICADYSEASLFEGRCSEGVSWYVLGCIRMAKLMAFHCNLPLSVSLIKQLLVSYGNEFDESVFDEHSATIQSVLDWYREQLLNIDKSNESFLRVLAEFHSRFRQATECISMGYWDVSRILLFRECLVLGVSPIIIHVDNVSDYFSALGDANNENYDELVKLFKKEQIITANYLRSLKVVW